MNDLGRDRGPTDLLSIPCPYRSLADASRWHSVYGKEPRSETFRMWVPCRQWVMENHEQCKLVSPSFGDEVLALVQCHHVRRSHEHLECVIQSIPREVLYRIVSELFTLHVT